jgi:hypothetical protein
MGLLSFLSRNSREGQGSGLKTRAYHATVPANPPLRGENRMCHVALAGISRLQDQGPIRSPAMDQMFSTHCKDLIV